MVSNSAPVIHTILPIQQELSKPVNRLCYRIARERDDDCEREWHGRG